MLKKEKLKGAEILTGARREGYEGYDEALHGCWLDCRRGVGAKASEALGSIQGV